ncbi:MAG: cyclic nucleotide-binding domain-containing protein [Pseudomonadota bacterium]
MQELRAADVIDSLGLPYLKGLSTFGALSSQVIEDMLTQGLVRQLEKGEYLARYGQQANEFQIVLKGRIAFYKHSSECDVLTRYFNAGEQMGFDLMIGMIEHNGIDVATEETLLLDVASDQFLDLHQKYPVDFGLLMINLTRELSREITMLENVIGDTTGWLPEAATDAPA